MKQLNAQIFVTKPVLKAICINQSLLRCHNYSKEAVTIQTDLKILIKKQFIFVTWVLALDRFVSMNIVAHLGSLQMKIPKVYTVSKDKTVFRDGNTSKFGNYSVTT